MDTTRQIFTTGEVVRLLGINKDRYYYLEENKKINSARRTGSGKRYFFEQDVGKLREQIKRLNQKQTQEVSK